jgi:hypothetical protein
MTALTPVWWRIEAWSRSTRRGPRKRVSFAVEARGPLGALRRVHDLGYVLDFEEEHVTAIPFERSFEVDYHLPLDCSTGSCPITPNV